MQLRKNMTSFFDGKYPEYLYLGYLALTIFVFYMKTTMVDLNRIFPPHYIGILRLLGILVITVKLIHDRKAWTKVELIYLLAVSVAFLGPYLTIRNNNILFVWLLVIGAKNIRFDTICKIYLLVEVPAICIVMVLSRFGIVEDILYEYPEHIAHAFGSIYRTDFCAHLFFLACCMLWISRKRIRYFEIAGIYFLAWFSMRYCHARNSFLCLALLGTVALIARLVSDLTKNHPNGIKSTETLMKIIGIPATCATLVMSLGSIYLSKIFNYENARLVWLDQLFSNRLALGRLGLDSYPITLFGQKVYQAGAGGHTDMSNGYFFLDNSYISILLILGLCALIAVLFIHTRLAVLAYKEKQWIAILILVILALHCTIEHHMIELAYNPFLLTLFANLAFPHEEKPV